MKTILSSQTMDIPEGVTVKVNAKIVEVEGPRGKLTRDFKHLNLDFELIEGGKKLKVDAWFGSRKTTAAIRTSLSHIDNLITGVTKGYRYKMRLVYAHFPINASITPNNSCIEIRNFLWEKKVPHRGRQDVRLPNARWLHLLRHRRRRRRRQRRDARLPRAPTRGLRERSQEGKDRGRGAQLGPPGRIRRETQERV
ncbi:60S ribosomal protein L9-like [Zingiber officinale]|uniref:60S ribosomal protein L9-like n=1 Tax=Zingiber officinale TaxID=94328 RepID=UPI001C4D9D77|nr:60S ribosomal protein L9-like [Zingiber officinale]